MNITGSKEKRFWTFKQKNFILIQSFATIIFCIIIFSPY